MKSKKSLFTPLLASLLLISSSPLADSVVFKPEAGTSLTKHFASSTEMSLEDFSVTINGSPPPMNMEDMKMTASGKQEITVTDEYESVKEGRPTKLNRTFDAILANHDMTISMPMMDTNQEASVEAKTDLEGQTVAFVYDEATGEYTRTFEAEGGDEELLEGLWEDMDFRYLLPPEGSAEEGSSWEVPVEQIKYLLAPGGKLSLVPEEGEDSGAMFGSMNQVPDAADYLEDLEGTATAEFAGTRDVEGVKVAAIRLKIDVRSAADMTQVVLDQMAEIETPEEMGMEFKQMDMEFETEGEGTLLWDVAKGHAHSFELSGSQTMLIDISMTMSPGEQTMEIEQSIEMSGNFSMTMALK